MDGYYSLAAAILRQAIMDYKSAVKMLIKHPKHLGALHDRDALRRFFRSEWFSVLSDLNGTSLMKKIETLTEEEMSYDGT